MLKKSTLAFKDVKSDFIRIFVNRKSGFLGTPNYSKWALIIIFSAIYLPHAFILINDINLISAYEVDPGSIITSINALFDSSPPYNMMNGYHSKFYGWTFMAINFFILIPVKFFNFITDNQSQVLTLLTIKLTFFSIGLLSTLALLSIFDRLTNKKNYLISFAVCLVFVFSPVTNLFYFIHPETTGILFIFTAIICLIEYIKNTYTPTLMLGVIFLVAASLSKQVFFISSLPVLFAFMHFYRLTFSQSFLNFITSINFYNFFKISIIIALIVSFIIHPYAFLYFKKFFQFQLSLSTSFIGDGQISYFQSLILWVNLIRGEFVMFFSFLTLPFVVVYSLFQYRKYKNPGYFLAAINGLAFIFVFLFVAYGNRTVLLMHYMLPSIIFLIFNMFFLFHWLIQRKKIFIRNIFKLFIFYFFVLSLSLMARDTISNSNKRFQYKESIAFTTFNYIKANMKKNDRVAHDQFIAIPSELNEISCHYWRGCGSDYIDEFNPNYVIFNVNPKWQPSGLTKELKRLMQYVDENKMVLVTKFKHIDKSYINVYRKP